MVSPVVVEIRRGGNRVPVPTLPIKKVARLAFVPTTSGGSVALVLGRWSNDA